MGGNARCELCGEYAELTEYQAREIDKILKICPGCKDWIKKYVELLKSYGYNPKKLTKRC